MVGGVVSKASSEEQTMVDEKLSERLYHLNRILSISLMSEGRKHFDEVYVEELNSAVGDAIKRLREVDS